jgi:dTDP-4-dehydrorhamnose 3,5-epimerase
MNRFNTPIQGVDVIETNPIADHRGLFTRFFCRQELGDILGFRHIVQINYSCTRASGSIRGLHFQHPPHAEMKLIRCLQGRVWDIAVDLRAGSPTFLRWHAEELTPENARMMVIPEGCAHGFQTLEPESALLYLHTAFYHPESEGGIGFKDPRLAIRWPLPAADLSDRDRKLPFVTNDFQGLKV